MLPLYPPPSSPPPLPPPPSLPPPPPPRLPSTRSRLNIFPGLFSARCFSLTPSTIPERLKTDREKLVNYTPFSFFMIFFFFSLVLVFGFFLFYFFSNYFYQPSSAAFLQTFEYRFCSCCWVSRSFCCERVSSFQSRNTSLKKWRDYTRQHHLISNAIAVINESYSSLFCTKSTREIESSCGFSKITLSLVSVLMNGGSVWWFIDWQFAVAILVAVNGGFRYLMKVLEKPELAYCVAAFA